VLLMGNFIGHESSELESVTEVNTQHPEGVFYAETKEAPRDRRETC
jgi:hypothetical protein